MNKYLKRILRKMCSMVHADYDKIDFQKHNWFWDYCWTEERESEFRKWMIEYLYKNKKAYKELYNSSYGTKRRIKENVRYFMFNYGWKVGTYIGNVKQRKIKEILK